MNLNKSNNRDFTVPEGYFESFKERLDAEIVLNELLGNKREAGFKVPEEYFKQNVDTLVQAATQQPVKVIKLNAQRWLWAAACAIVIIVAVIGINSKTVTLTNDIEDLAEIEAYLIEDEFGISATELAGLLSDEDFDSLMDELYPDSTDDYINFLNESSDVFDLYTE